MGERLVLEQLYGRHAQGVRRYLTRLVGNHDAEDLTHDVFEKAQRALNTHRAFSKTSCVRSSASWLPTSRVRYRRTPCACRPYNCSRTDRKSTRLNSSHVE